MKPNPSLVLILTLCGCGTASTPTAQTSVGQSEPVAVAAEEPKDDAPAVSDAAAVTGTWENSSCGERKYRRRVIVEPSGKLLGTDFVAPCPPRAQCVWSGIVGWRGTWVGSSDGIVVTLEPLAGDSPGSAALPESFAVLSGDEPVLAEKSGVLVCPYQRVR